MKLYFVRHGETNYNRKGMIQGRLDSDLSLVGFKQARLTRERLGEVPFGYGFTSPLKRAVQTAEELVRDRDVVIHKMASLNNTDVGEWQGQQWTSLMKKFKLTHGSLGKVLKERGGESFEDVSNRYEQFVKEIASLQTDNILVISHAAVIYAAIKHAIGFAKDKRLAMSCDNCGITIIETDGANKWQVRCVNDTTHLEQF